MTDGRYLAIDWGTTNRRIYLMDPTGQALETERDGRGVLTLSADDYPMEIDRLRARFGAIPIVAAGMVGSTRGWRDTPYVAAPAGIEALARAAMRMPAAGMAIVPGVSIVAPGRADVMRGEEVQVLGAVRAGLAPSDARFCQPGTHNKWIRVEDSRIVDFSTAMTGELFALLRDHSVLAEMMRGPVTDGPAFRDGVEAGRGGGLLTALFGVRAGVLLGRLDRDDAAAFASGLLIGADVAAQLAQGDVIHVLSGGTLRALYAGAIALLGGHAVAVDAEAAFLAGIHLVKELLDA
jgi:2-dehydro-3-deoxygalactonokinase